MSNKKYLFSVSEDVHSRFQRDYPRLLAVFLRRCMIRANEDKGFFRDVYFGTKDPYNPVGMNRPEYSSVDND